jgi:lipopolysaccharide export system permease protein
MRLLDRYILKELLAPLGYCLAGFLLFWISFDLFSELNEFQEKGMGAGEVARYYWFKLPELMGVVIPMALLLALLYALTNHARHQELTAMRAAGVSLGRICAPYFVAGFLFSLGLFALHEFWIPLSSERARHLKNPPEARSEGEGPWEINIHFRNGKENRFWNIGAFNLATFELRRTQVSWELRDGSRRTLMAAEGARKEGAWEFYDAQMLVYPAEDFENWSLIQTNVLRMPEFEETPEQIKSALKISRLSSIRAAKDVQLSVQEIWNYLRLHPELKEADRALLLTQLHGALARPWVCLVVVLIAVSFGAPSGRRNIFVGVASSILLSFSFFVLMRFGLALGTGNYLAPWLAAWLPNLVFGTAGLVLMRRVD